MVNTLTATRPHPSFTLGPSDTVRLVIVTSGKLAIPAPGPKGPAQGRGPGHRSSGSESCQWQPVACLRQVPCAFTASQLATRIFPCQWAVPPWRRHGHRRDRPTSPPPSRHISRPSGKMRRSTALKGEERASRGLTYSPTTSQAYSFALRTVSLQRDLRENQVSRLEINFHRRTNFKCMYRHDIT